MNAPYRTSGSRAEPPPVAQSTWMPVLALGRRMIERGRAALVAEKAKES